MQATGVQIVGLEVGGGDKTHAVFKQRDQQPIQNHRVGDVGNVKFVKANQLVALGHARAQHVQRILRALQAGQLAVHFAHKFVKVQARFALDRHRVKKAIHQKALAAPNAAKHIHAARNFWAVDQLFQRIGAARFVQRPIVSAALQRLDGAALGGIALETLGHQLGFISPDNRVRQGGTSLL